MNLNIIILDIFVIIIVGLIEIIWITGIISCILDNELFENWGKFIIFMLIVNILTTITYIKYFT